jgi:adenylate cyclase
VEHTAIGHAARHPRYWPVFAAVLVLAAVAIYGVMRYARATSATGPGADLSSIVVIPFSNLSDDKDDSFSDGLSEELINALTRIPQLHVVGRTSAFQYKRKALDVRKIGQELNVRTVLAGSVRRYGDRLRITAELSDTSNGYSLWSESYDRQIKDTLAIQREISHAISRSLGMQLASSRATRSPEIQTPVNPEAYLEYLRGLYYWNRATGENLKLAIGHFEKAIALNPAYAQAYAGLASSYVLIPSYTNTPAM